MASVTQTQRERKRALAQAIAQLRAMDSKIEILQRRCYRIRAKKRLIQPDDALALDPLWRAVKASEQTTERALADFISIVQI